MQCRDNVTELDVELWCQQHDFPPGQRYKVAMSAHCEQASILI